MAITVDRVPSPGAVLLGGLRTLTRRAPSTPVLPGDTLVRREVAIDADMLADYRALCGFTAAQGVPPIFPHLLAFPLHMLLMMRPGFPYPLPGTVHIANRIVQHAALAVGDRLTVSARFGDFATHPRGQAFGILAWAERDGMRVWESESAYLRIGARSTLGPPVATLGEADAANTRTGEETVPRSVAPRYARLSGDRNPIHMSWLGARLFGFKRPIAHGMWTKARALARVLPENAGAIAIDVAFRAPVLLPGRITHFADPAGDATAFAVRDGAGTRLHLIGRIGPIAEDTHAQHR